MRTNTCSAIANTKPLINQKIFKHTASLSTTTGNNSTSNIHQAAGDSGASSHHFRVSDTAKLTNIQDTKSPISIQTAWLQLPTLSSDGSQVHIFRAQDLTEFSLVTIGQLCDADCTAHYDKSRMWVTDKHDTDIIVGTRNATTGLYMINTDDLTAAPPTREVVQHQAATVTPLRSTTIEQRVAFWVASMGGPVMSTLLHVMKRGT